MSKHTSRQSPSTSHRRALVMLTASLVFFAIMNGLLYAQSYDTHKTVPSATSSLSVYQQYLIHEDAERHDDLWNDRVIDVSCYHGTSGSTTTSAFPCVAYVNGYYVNQAADTVTYTSGDNTYWLAIHADTTTAVSGWTREAGTHYLWIVSASKPTIPDSLHLVEQVTVSGSAITATVSWATRVIRSSVTVSSTQTWSGRTFFEPEGFVTVSSGFTLTLTLCPDANPAQWLFDADASTTGSVVLNCSDTYADWYGILGDDSTVTTTRLTALCTMFATLRTNSPTPRKLIFRSSGIYRFGNATCDLSLADGLPDSMLTFDFTGAMLVPTTSGIMIDWNTGGDCNPGAGNWSGPMRRVRFIGTGAVIDGDYATTANTAIGFKMYVMRDVHVVGFTFRELDTGILMCGQDNMEFADNRFISDIHGILMDKDSAYGAIKTTANGMTNTIFRRNIFNLTTGISLDGINLETALGSTKFLNNNFSGDGGGSGYCHLTLDNTHSTQSSQGVTIDTNHFESLANNGTYICVKSTGGNNWDALSIFGNHLEFPSGCNTNCTAVALAYTQNFRGFANAVSCPAGSGLVTYALTQSTTADLGPDDQDGQCTYVTWDGTMTRDNFTKFPYYTRFADAIRTEVDSTGTTYFDGSTGLGDITVTMDMSHASNLSGDLPDIVAKYYDVRIILQDSEAMTSTVTANYPQPSVRIRTDSSHTNGGDFFVCGDNSAKNNQQIMCEGSVIPDANGDFQAITDAVEAVLTSTLKASIWILGIKE